MFKKMVCAVVLCVAVAPQMHAQEKVSADVQTQVLERQLEDEKDQYLETVQELSAVGTPCAIVALASVIILYHPLLFPFGIYFSYKSYSRLSQLLSDIKKQRESMKKYKYKIALYRAAQMSK